tara:strand:- start:57 stop:440 length:384 start_codon:yes stop_codon:yes gene_type:complete
MTQDELQAIASKRLGTIMTQTQDKFCTFDAHSNDYVLEFKCRRAHYDTQLIEHKKFVTNLDQADESGREFLYIVSTPKDVYVFNVSKLARAGYDFGWEDRTMPTHTDFSNKSKKDKKVGYISTSSSS